MFRNTEHTTTTSEQAAALLASLPVVNLSAGPSFALTEGVIRVQERLQTAPSILPTPSDLTIVAKYSQMNAHMELQAGRDASALAWARVALRLWEDVADQSLVGAAVMALLDTARQG